MIKDIKKFVENIVYDRNDILARLAFREKVDLTTSNWDSFKPNDCAQNDALEELTELEIYLEQGYKSFRLPRQLPEIFQYCKERHKFNENWGGIQKHDALRLLGLESSSILNTLFKGAE
jgi:hypothetical protein